MKNLAADRVLVIAPHMDDEVLGAGGALARHASQGAVTAVCIVANRAYDHVYDAEAIEQEKGACRAAQEVLGYGELFFLGLPDERLDASLIEVIKPLEKVVEEFRPEAVYLPHAGDLNQDHRAVAQAALVACRPQAPHAVKILLSYETPSSSDQVPALAGEPFRPNVYTDIVDWFQAKTAALACYERESRPYPHPRSERGLKAWAEKRGMEVGLEMAEAFCLLRWVS